MIVVIVKCINRLNIRGYVKLRRYSATDSKMT